MMTGLGFAGFGLLLPTAPLWAAHGGASEAGVGLVNAVLMLVTVVTQTAVPRALHRIGWRPTLLVGMALLGAPALLHPLSDDLTTVLVLSGVRGVGFGVLTVCGAAAVARLAAPELRGRAIGAYGLAIAAPQLVLVPLGPWLAEHVGFGPVLAAAACPLLALLPASRLGRLLDDRPAPAHADDTPHPKPLAAVTWPLMSAIVVLLVITTAGGALITFTPQFGIDPTTSLLSLLSLTGAAAVARWRLGGFADRFGPQPFFAPLLLLAGVGLGVIAWAISDPGAPREVLLPLAMALVGISYGGLQNVTLVAAFAAVPERQSNAASAAWNIGFDTGTGLGSLAVGVIAAGGSFGPSVAVTAALCLVAVPVALTSRGRAARHQ
ncbi:MFS transporter [Nocardioides antri]|uniref:MFS transporter n=2 Tax=Nocardioides antri TaxID=2607659 RepID=A0A5B1M2Y9_9ACTN|nr:MFS transporter [Nocardioides antri]